MKRLIYFALLILGTLSCSSKDENITMEYEFIHEYKTTVTVGGILGTTERVFKVGEIYTGTNQGNEMIRIRIAEHSKLNDDCPNSWCYQEFLEVPRLFLKRVN